MDLQFYPNKSKAPVHKKRGISRIRKSTRNKIWSFIQSDLSLDAKSGYHQHIDSYGYGNQSLKIRRQYVYAAIDCLNRMKEQYSTESAFPVLILDINDSVNDAIHLVSKSEFTVYEQAYTRITSKIISKVNVGETNFIGYKVWDLTTTILISAKFGSIRPPQFGTSGHLDSV